MPTILLAKALFYWGFSVRTIGSSAASLSYVILPPQTLIGALTWSLSKILDLPEVYKGASTTRLFIDRNIITWSTAKLEGTVIPYSDIVRMERSPYVRERYRIDIARQFGVSSMGKVYAPLLRATIAYIVDPRKLQDLLNELRISIQDIIGTLKRATYSIVRIGSKESLVAVEDIEVLTNTESKPDSIETSFYVPELCVEKADGEYETVSIPAYSDAHYSIHGGVDIGKEVRILVPIERRFVPPVFGGKVRIKLRKDRCVAIPIDGDAIVYPLEGIRGLKS